MTNVVPFNPSAKTNRTKVDWIAAWSFYASDMSLTYKDVAGRFSVSVETVRRHGRKHGWEAKRAELAAQAAQQMEAKAIRSLGERQRETIKVADILRDKIIQNSEKIEVRDALTSLPAYAKLEQLYGGAPTENLRNIPNVDLTMLTDEELELLTELLSKCYVGPEQL